MKAACDLFGEERKGYKSPSLLHLMSSLLLGRSLIEKPRGSNSIEQELSFVNLRTEIRFLIMAGACRTLESKKFVFGVCRVVVPVPRTGKVDPLPTKMREELFLDKGQ